MKALIVYTSLSGNTKDLAELINYNLVRCGFNVHVSSAKEMHSPQGYDVVFIGSYTWGDGDLPVTIRKYLKRFLIESRVEFPVSVAFGTGETQFGLNNYCRAVDEIKHHLSKNTRVLSTLKIEQNPIGKEDQVKSFIEKIMEEMQT
jgi:predicted ribonucleotide reductase-associated flavodoxin